MTSPIFTTISFQWDDGNHKKNKIKHDVTTDECEQIFFNRPLILLDDVLHSQLEKRWFALGRTITGRKLTIAFTKRDDQIRIISARDMSRRERIKYEKI